MRCSLFLLLPLLQASVESKVKNQQPIAIEQRLIPKYSQPAVHQRLTGIIALGDLYASGSGSTLFGKKYTSSWPQILKGLLGTELSCSSGPDVPIGDPTGYFADYSHSQIAVITTGFEYFNIKK